MSNRDNSFKIWIGLLLTAFCLLAANWGFFAHKKINYHAVLILPHEMIGFYKQNIEYLSKHAVDADRRRYVDPEEAARHYFDADHFGATPFDSVPHKWVDAVAKLSEDTLKAYGVLPWHLENMFYRLVKAFRENNEGDILNISANLGHYVADAHVPLHTTENYNGQLTGQKGIHAFWESRLPELFYEEWDVLTGRAVYVKDIRKECWKIISESFSAKDSVLQLEKKLRSNWPSDQVFTHEKKRKVYTKEYSQVYQLALNGMVEKQMRKAILSVGSFWYTAWVNAGQPDLNKLEKKVLNDSLGVILPDTAERKNRMNLQGHED